MTAPAGPPGPDDTISPRHSPTPSAGIRVTALPPRLEGLQRLAMNLAWSWNREVRTLFRDIDELTFNLLPQLERFEGKLRVSRQQLAANPELPQPQPAPVGE